MAENSSPTESPSISTFEIQKEPESGSTAIKKLNWRVSPFCAFITILAYIDRGNLGFAAAKICNELKLSHSEYGIGASLFFVGYVFSQIPSNILLKRFGPSRWLAFLLVAWGIIASSLAFVQNHAQFYFLRFLLGLAEGGCFPGVWYYISLFFPNLWTAAPYALVSASIQLASPASAPLAAGLLALDGHIGGIDGWRLLFFVEGIVPIVYGALLPWILPESPDKAFFLSEEEKAWLDFKLKENQHPVSTNTIDQFTTVFKNTEFWKLTTFEFFHFIILNAGLYWTTLIIDEMLNEEEEDDEDTCAPPESTGAIAVILTTIPFTIAAACCIYIGQVAPRIKNRPVASGSVASIGALFWIIWVLSRHHAFVIALLSLGLALSSANVPVPLVLGMLTSHFDTETKAAALSGLNTISSFSGVIGTATMGFLVDHYGYLSAAFFLAASSLLSGVVLFLVNDPHYNVSSGEGHQWERMDA